MGCKTYDAENHKIHFSDANDEFMCLCTFPHNDNLKLTPDRVRALALLGAAVALLHTHDIDTSEEWQYIPFCLPEWIIDGIKQIIPDDES